MEAVAAVVVPRPGVTLTPEDVIEHTRGLLAGFKTPKYVVVADALPKNPSGKILKRQLRDEHADLAAGADGTRRSARIGCRHDLLGSRPCSSGLRSPSSSLGVVVACDRGVDFQREVDAARPPRRLPVPTIVEPRCRSA